MKNSIHMHTTDVHCHVLKNLQSEYINFSSLFSESIYVITSEVTEILNIEDQCVGHTICSNAHYDWT